MVAEIREAGWCEAPGGSFFQQLPAWPLYLQSSQRVPTLASSDSQGGALGPLLEAVCSSAPHPLRVEASAHAPWKGQICHVRDSYGKIKFFSSGVQRETRPFHRHFLPYARCLFKEALVATIVIKLERLRMPFFKALFQKHNV